MIKVEKIDVWGFEHAIRGMRNPMNSWNKSDSEWKWIEDNSPINPDDPGMCFVIGKNDLDLMRKLYKAGSEHRTYARMIQCSMDITAPLYWWKEMDRYTVGKSQVSCSTMHKIAAKEFELDDFSWEHLLNTGCDLFNYEFGKGSFATQIQPLFLLKDFIIPALNECRERYIETKDKIFWWQLIQLLPSSYNQKRTICMSYETVFKIIRERTGHRLDEWNDFVKILRSLPYIAEIIDETNNICRIKADTKNVAQ